MVGVGIVGIGFMGMTHYLAAQRTDAIRVVAICSRDPKKLAGDWTAIQGNFGPRGTRMDLSGLARHREFEELLADPSVQLVDLCVPNDEHAPMAIRALRAGKHVLVEKPVALTSADADAMLDASRSSGRLLMVAHVLPFFPEFAYAAEAVRSGRFGKLRAAHLSRVIARPDWSTGITDAARSGGPAVDLHIHDTHFISLVCGVPRAVSSRGVSESGSVVHINTHYLYDDPDLTVSAVSGAISQSGRPFTHGFEFYLERATISFQSANLGGRTESSPLTLILPEGKVERPEIGPPDPSVAFSAELAMAAGAVDSGIEPPSLSARLARQALVLCLAEQESVKAGIPVMIA